ncbi:hypothetical protein IG193_00770 [Infirmifilum lucidum]|uniref:Uncharacterized protein n=1 Tax=Infirmifilum lucidum TaxID=2776706 RepID=A0A7L9FI40_9CREN|nr:hypothetical protein [Infirmifilum lucidum]QOJ79032.1 hypothetical protein IG193_00770 [Infirmifilum lucidum]
MGRLVAEEPPRQLREEPKYRRELAETTVSGPEARLVLLQLKASPFRAGMSAIGLKVLGNHQLMTRFGNWCVAHAVSSEHGPTVVGQPPMNMCGVPIPLTMPTTGSIAPSPVGDRGNGPETRPGAEPDGV